MEENTVLKIPPESYFRLHELSPDDSNMESNIGGAFVDDLEKVLYIFKITTRNIHQMSYHDLVKLAENMQKTESIASGELEIRLVFIVPEENEASFSKQTINFNLFQPT
jgi:hypothetical protein